MADKFLELSLGEQAELYGIASSELGRDVMSLEKDVWVCWTLEALFACPDMPKMAFKGGTSLSKVYDAIARFSEDIDVTMDCEELTEDDPFEPASNRVKKALDEELKAQVNKHSLEKVVPYLESRIAAAVLDVRVEVENGGEVVHVHYPTALGTEGRPGYLLDTVKIEFGGRNLTEPCERHDVTPYMTETTGFEALAFPVAQVEVLSGERTFWEKYTLAHEAVQRSSAKATVARQSRHWYDLYRLDRHDIGTQALARLEILDDVVRVKERFFRSGSSNYHLCLQGAATIVPTGEMYEALATDYNSMVEAEMLDEDPPSFDQIAGGAADLQERANRALASRATAG